MGLFENQTTEDKIFKKTEKQLNDVATYAQKHPIEASLAIGALFVATVFFPTPIMLTLCLSTLVLLAFNAFAEPSFCDNLSNMLGL